MYLVDMNIMMCNICFMTCDAIIKYLNLNYLNYNALFTILITTACVVQWNEGRPPDLGVAASPVGAYTFSFF